MDAVAIRSCIVATLDSDPNNRKRAELQLKQVRNTLSLSLITAPCPVRIAPTRVLSLQTASAEPRWAWLPQKFPSSPTRKLLSLTPLGVCHRQRNTTAFSMLSSTSCSPNRMQIFVSPVRVTLFKSPILYLPTRSDGRRPVAAPISSRALTRSPLLTRL